MSLVVQKFGGTSLGSISRLKEVAQRIKKESLTGKQLCIVVSAMGHSTDELDALAKQIATQPAARELDLLLSTGEQVSTALLAIALQKIGVEAIALTGGQAGILTTDHFTQAEILEIDQERIMYHISTGKVVIVAGFQGFNQEREITTLGRGGSDITAVALAGILGATHCEIFTDVRGVYTADPRLVPTAQMLSQISYDEMLEYAKQGAQVLHPRAVEWAKQHQVALLVQSSFEQIRGTWILNEERVSPPAFQGITYQRLNQEEAMLAIIRHSSASSFVDDHLVMVLEQLNLPPTALTSTERRVSCVIPWAKLQQTIQYIHHVLGLDAQTESESGVLIGHRVIHPVV